MNEYWEYIKWLAKSLYKKELELLGNVDVNCVFYDEIDYKIFNNDIVIIMDCSSISETVRKIYRYTKSIEDKFKIMDISVFKGNDSENYSETYLVSIYCVDKTKYIENSEKYDNVFKLKQANFLTLQEKINRIIEQKVERNIEINNILHEGDDFNINQIYAQTLDCIIQENDTILENLDENSRNNDNIKKDFNKSLEVVNERVLKDTDVDYIDRILKIKDAKKIKKYRNMHMKYKRVMSKNIIEDIHNTDFSSIVIIDCVDDEVNKKYAKIFSKLKSKVIVISKNEKVFDNNVIVLKSLISALQLIKGCKALYINDNNEKIDNPNVLSISLTEACSGIFGIRNAINKIIEKKEGLLAFSNIDNINSIKVLTSTFFDFNGENYCSGGAERYLIDLHQICKNLGMKLRVYQKANYDFFRYYNDIEIVGISNNNEDYYYGDDQNKGILERFNNISENKTKLNIYSAFTECYGKALSPSIGISHGISWDYPKNTHPGKYEDKGWIIDAAMSCDKLVSVDTNTANYFQTVDYKLGNSTEVIPNYVNINEFISENNKNDDDKIVIVYPRRLCEARGLYLLLDIVDDLISKYENIEIHFVGKGVKRDLDAIQKKIDKWGEKYIKLYNCPPEKMYEVYRKADISVIPTLYSEGTSLSCLEAMSTGNAVIATRVGGLTDLIINNYNGKLIAPNKNSLFKAIDEFLQDRELMNRCRKNAREVAKVFNKDIWINNWETVIKNNSKNISPQKNVSYDVVMIYVSDENMETEKLKKIIFKRLLDKNLVYIVNNNADKKESYGRLQYINEDEDLYRKPNSVLIDKDYKTDKKLKGKHINLK